MVDVSIVNAKGDENYHGMTVEQAEELIGEFFEEAKGQRYFIVDKETNEILKEIKLKENQSVVLVPIVGGG